MIDRLRVQNFRCLRDVDVPLGPLNFLVGPNNSGKSSFVDAVYILSRCVAVPSISMAFAKAEDGPQAGRHSKPWFQRTMSKTNGDDSIGFDGLFSRITVGGKRASVRHGIRLAGSGALIREESVSPVDPDGPEVPMDRATGSQVSMLASMPKGAARATLDVVRAALSVTPVYRLVPARISEPCPLSQNPELAEDGYGLATWLDAFRDADPRRFEQIEEVLRNLVPGMDRVTFPTLPNNYKTILFHEKWGAKVHATEASDGLLLFLAYLAIAYAHPDVGVVLLEEPETGVHPRRLGDIVRLLRGMSRGETGLPPVQVIATSHSPYLLDWCGKDEVIFFDRDDSGNIRTKPLSDVPEIDDRIEDFESLGAFIYAAGETLCKSPS